MGSSGNIKISMKLFINKYNLILFTMIEMSILPINGVHLLTIGCRKQKSTFLSDALSTPKMQKRGV